MDPGKRSGYRAHHRREVRRKAGIGKEEDVSGRERFSSFIRRPFSPKHETANQQDRPASRGIDSSGRNIAVVEIVSRGSNKGFAGESGVCSFSENWRCHGTETITLLASSKRGAFSILRSGYFYLDPYHEEHPRVFATNIRYRMMSLAWMETYGVS